MQIAVRLSTVITWSGRYERPQRRWVASMHQAPSSPRKWQLVEGNCRRDRCRDTPSHRDKQTHVSDVGQNSQELEVIVQANTKPPINVLGKHPIDYRLPSSIQSCWQDVTNATRPSGSRSGWQEMMGRRGWCCFSRIPDTLVPWSAMLRMLCLLTMILTSVFIWTTHPRGLLWWHTSLIKRNTCAVLIRMIHLWFVQ